jgi:SAM-dependent methyltransferase
MTGGEGVFGSWEAAVLWLRAQPDRQTLVRDAFYDDPLAAAALRYWTSEEWVAVRALLGAPRGEALDLGAGRGIASYALAREGFSVTALEPDASAIVGAGAIRALAASEKLPIEVVEDVGERLPFEAGRFRVVFARAVLHHTKDLRAACREVFRVLEPGGRLIAVREHVISRQADLPAFLDAHPLHRLYGGENAFLEREYAGALVGAGFRLNRVLRSFDSAINYYPQTRQGLREELVRRAERLPGAAPVLRQLLSSEARMSLTMKLLSRMDWRPGRLHSFVCDKPA